MKCQIGISSWGDDKTFNAQYPKPAVRYNESFHDRFLIIDDKELYLIHLYLSWIISSSPNIDILVPIMLYYLQPSRGLENEEV